MSNREQMDDTVADEQAEADLIVALGYSAASAWSALKANDGDVDRAIESLERSKGTGREANLLPNYDDDIECPKTNESSFEEDPPAPSPRRSFASTQAVSLRPGAIAVAGPDAEDYDYGPRTASTLASTSPDSTSIPIAAEVVENHDADFCRIQDQLRVHDEQLQKVLEAPIAHVVNEQNGKSCNRKRKGLFVVVAGLVSVVLVGIVLGVVLSNNDDPKNTTSTTTSSTPPSTVGSPPTTSTATPTTTTATLPQDLVELISSASLDGGTALQDPSTPQHDALVWLADNLKIDEYSDEKKLQRYVLGTLYYSTNGPGWEEQANWMRNEDECNWYNDAEGPFCSTDGTIIELDLWKNSLSGTLPDEIALLSDSLLELNMGANRLGGTVPSTIIEHLTKLVYLSLHDTHLTGSIPTTVGLWSRNLTTLSLSINSLSGEIPSDIELLTNLESLRLYGNDFDVSKEYTCPTYIDDCRVGCDRKDDSECRSYP